MLIVGLTGGIASGKSTIARALKGEPGVAVIDADKIAWETYQPGTEVYERLVEHFGSKILKPDGTINRHALGTLVFQNPKERDFLNCTVHPVVLRRLRELARSYEAQGVEILIVEAALLLEFEPVARDFFDCYVMVWVDPKEQLRRLMQRDGLSREAALQKIRSQTPPEEKRKRADFVIESGGEPQETIQRAKALLSELRRRAKNL